ncbi:MAG TPA: hypothetical protein VIF82_09915 [Burkholderiaceae bacterium]
MLAVALHAALLSALPASTPLSIHHWPALSAHVESRRPVQMVSIASVFSPNTTHALIPVKVKQKTSVAESALPKMIAEAPAGTPRYALTAAPPQAAPAPAGPVVGLALPQSGVMQGHRRLWSFQQGTTMSDEQALRQAQMQHEAQLAIQAGRAADREKFEAQLMIALGGVQLNSPCQVIIPPAKLAHLHCENDLDAKAVRAVLIQSGDAPVIQTDATFFIIDLAPRQSGGTQAVSRHSNVASLQELNF